MNLSLLLSLCCQTGACSLCNPTDRSTLASGIHMGGKDSPSLCHWVDTFQGFYVAPSSAKTTSCLKAGFGTLASKWRECFIVGGGWGFFFGRLQHNSPSHTICMCRFTKSPAILSVLSTENSHICSLRAANLFSRD